MTDTRRVFTRTLLATAVTATSQFGFAPLANAQGGVLEEIIVTASRRAESLQDTSLIVEAMTGLQMQERGVTDMFTLAREVPSLTVGHAGPALQLQIRGVGSDAASGFTSPGLAVSKDGVYIPRVTAMSSQFFDLQRVEVLKGPQGTLYGRNATGGAINLITNGAELGEISGFATVEGGNYDKVQFDGAINIPMGENFATRLSAFVTQRDGYMSDGTAEDERWATRASFLWTPTDDIQWRFQGQYAENGGNGIGSTWVGSPDPWESIFPGVNDLLLSGAEENGLVFPDIAFPWIENAPVQGPAPTPPFPPGTNFIYGINDVKNDRGDQDLEFWDVSTTFEWDLDFATLTVLGAYQDVEQSYISQTSVLFGVGRLFGEDVPETSETTSLEVRLNGDTDNFTWVVGANFFNEEQTVYNAINQGIVQNLQLGADIETDAIGLFGELTWNLTDNLRLIGGLRYSDEEQEKTNFNRYTLSEAIACPPAIADEIINGLAVCQISGPGEDKISDDNVDWKVGVEYDVNENSMVFFSVSTGFKAGGLPAVDSSYGPEYLTAYSLGAKNIFMDGRLQLNADLFYWDYEDKQENLVGPDRQGIIGLNTVNAGESTIQGIGMDIQFAATAQDFFALNFEYLDAEYDEFSYFQGAAVTAPTTCDVTETGEIVPGPPPTGVTPELFIDCSGFPMTKAPEWTGRAAYTHTFNFGDAGELDANVSVQYVGERWLSANFLEGQEATDHTFWNAYLMYRPVNLDLSVMAYIENIGDEESYQVSLNHTQVPQFIGIVPGLPETYGVRLRYDF
ncbi:MAG: TonB-dependent receptor [Pseudomonadota bacterium]